jgi:hypothetical protein
MPRRERASEHRFYIYGNSISGDPDLTTDRFSFVLDARSDVEPRSFLLWIFPEDERKALLCKIRRVSKPADLGLKLEVSDVKSIKIVIHGLLNTIFPEERRRSGRTGRDHQIELTLLREIIEIPDQKRDHVINAIVKGNAPSLTKEYFRFPDTEGDSELALQTKDALRTALRIFGIGPEVLRSLREHQILDHDIDTIFEDLDKLAVTPDGRYLFKHNGRRLYLHKVDRTKLETYLGVDLIYNFLDEQRLVFVQYKCQKAKGCYYPSGDRSHDAEVERMKSIPDLGGCYNIGLSDESGVRLCRCPVYLKLCKREVAGPNLTPVGVYYPLCAWTILVRRHTGLSVGVQPHINNQQFQELVRAGLIGSTSDQTRKIQQHLLASSQDQRLKLIFEDEPAG